MHAQRHRVCCSGRMTYRIVMAGHDPAICLDPHRPALSNVLPASSPGMTETGGSRRADASHQWRIENLPAIGAYNARIDADGLTLARYRRL